MKSIKVLSMMFILSIYLAGCFSSVVSAEPNIEELPDAEIEIRGRRGVLVDIMDLRENQSTGLPIKVFCNFSYLLREPYHHLDIDNVWGGVGIIFISPYFVALGRFNVEAYAGNTYKKATGMCFGRWIKLY